MSQLEVYLWVYFKTYFYTLKLFPFYYLMRTTKKVWVNVQMSE